jgi:hypothetical protein
MRRTGWRLLANKTGATRLGFAVEVSRAERAAPPSGALENPRSEATPPPLNVSTFERQPPLITIHGDVAITILDVRQQQIEQVEHVEQVAAAGRLVRVRRGEPLLHVAMIIDRACPHRKRPRSTTLEFAEIPRQRACT